MKSSPPDCIWYVSGFKQPWEADVVSNLAEALRSRGMSLQVYSKGGTAHLRAGAGEVMSWNSLTFFERMKAVLFGGKLWHLWGDAPSWWGLVRLRARTIHTSLSAKPVWRGHPTRLFKEQTSDGENRILPTFEAKAAWTDNSPLDDVFVADDTPGSALQAAFLTMRGVPVVAKDTPIIRELLGAGGFIAIPQEDDGSELEKAKKIAASDGGRSISAAARRFLKDNYGAAAAAESLESLYGSVGRDRS